jgi:hypothetical protein
VAPELADLQRRVGSRATFVYVYVDEAHAEDEWPIGNAYSHGVLPCVAKQPKTTRERRAVVDEQLLPFLRREAPALLPSDATADATANANAPIWLIDPPETHLFEDVYAPWPIRFYIVHKGRMHFIAEPVDGQFSVRKLERQLDAVVCLNGQVSGQVRASKRPS